MIYAGIALMLQSMIMNKVLYGGDGQNAEIVDASKGQNQTLRGTKIKFWIDSEQAEVLDATIVAPVSGGGSTGLGDVIRGGLGR